MATPIPPFSPLRSAAQAFCRSPGQARFRGSQSLFSIVAAVYWFNGFGTFKAAGSQPNVAGSGTTSHIGDWVTNSDWPNVYNTMTETWADGGGTQVTVTECTPDIDLANSKVTTTGSASGISGFIVSVTATGTLITVTYSGGVYTAQLSGTTLAPTSTGPFNPSTDWATLVGIVNTMLGSVSIPSPASGSLWTYIQWQSTTPGYNTFTVDYPTGSPTEIGVVCPAINGLPLVLWESIDSGWMMPSINDNVACLTGTPPQPSNSGFCISLKSTWIFNGRSWYDPGTIIYAPTSRELNTCRTLYAQEFDPATFSPGLCPIAAGAINLAMNFVSPPAPKSTVSFGPADVTANLTAGTYGLLGFQPTAF